MSGVICGMININGELVFIVIGENMMESFKMYKLDI